MVVAPNVYVTWNVLWLRSCRLGGYWTRRHSKLQPRRPAHHGLYRKHLHHHRGREYRIPHPPIRSQHPIGLPYRAKLALPHDRVVNLCLSAAVISFPYFLLRAVFLKLYTSLYLVPDPRRQRIIHSPVRPRSPFHLRIAPPCALRCTSHPSIHCL